MKRADRITRAELARTFRAAQRAELVRLRAELANARKHRHLARARVRKICAGARAAHRARAKRLRAQLAAELRLAHSKVKACPSMLERTDKRELAAITAAQVELQRERSTQAALRIHGKRNAFSTPAPTRAERGHESDDEVERDIDPELVQVWARVKHRIKPGRRSTRTEAFAQWVHDHGAEVDAIVNEALDADVRHLIRQERDHARAMRRRPSLDAIPF